MIAVDIISKIVSKGTGKAPSTVGGESNFDLSDYLLKEIWEKVFEIKTDAAGNEYIFGKLPVVTKYGITMYGEELPGGGSSSPSYSSLGALLNVDDSIDSTASVDRVLFQAAGSSMWVSKPLSEIGGGSSGGGSVSGNYLPLSGGTINGAGNYLYVPLFVNALNNQISGITFKTNGTERGHIGYHYEFGMRLHTTSTAGIAVSNSDVPIFYTEDGAVKNTILHTGNYSSYALPLSGGTITHSALSNILVVKGTGSFNSWKTPIQVLTPDIQAEGHVNIEVGKVSTARNVAWFGLKYYGDGSYDNLLTMGLHSVDDALVINGYGNVGIGTPNPSNKVSIVHNSTSDGDIIMLKSNASWSGIIFNAASGDTWSINASTTNDFYLWNSYLNARVLVLSHSGNLLVQGGVTMYSDQRKKTILNHVELSLKQIADAPLIEHYYNSDQDKTTHVGSIAQYWAELNDWFCKLDAEGFYTMEIQNCALASAISIARHLEKYESKTDKTIRKMKKRIQELEDKLEKLEGGNYVSVQ